MTNRHGSTTDWIVHPRVPYEKKDRYYQRQRTVLRFINRRYKAMGLTGEERIVLTQMLYEAPPTWPWKYTLEGTAQFAAQLFPISEDYGGEVLGRSIRGLRRKGFLNVGKVEQLGSRMYEGKVVQHPVLEATPNLIEVCRSKDTSRVTEFWDDRGVLTGHLKTRVLKKKLPTPPRNAGMLSITEFIYDPDPHVQQALNRLTMEGALSLEEYLLGEETY